MKVRVEDHTKKIIDETDLAVDVALEIIGGFLERYAKQNLTSSGAVDTGLLRNSVTYAVSGKSPNIKSYHADRGSNAGSENSGIVKTGRYSGTVGSSNEKAVYVGTNVEYAQYIEFGTSRMKPRPYLKTAVENHLNEYREIFKRELRKVGK